MVPVHEEYSPTTKWVLSLLNDEEFKPYIEEFDLSVEEGFRGAVKRVLELEYLRNSLRDNPLPKPEHQYVTGGFGNMAVLI